MKEHITVVGTLSGISGVFLALSGLESSPIPWLENYDNLKPYLLYFGIGLFLISILFTFHLIYNLVNMSLDIISTCLRGSRLKELNRFIVTDVSESQLEIAFSFISNVLANEGVLDVIEYKRFKEFWNINNGTYGIIWDTKESFDPKIVGFVAAFPLTNSATERIMKGNLRGKNLVASDIQEADKEIRGYFIGAIGGNSIRAKAEVLRLMESRLTELSLKDRRPTLFTVPYTSRGRAAAKKYGFSPQLSYGDVDLWIRPGM